MGSLAPANSDTSLNPEVATATSQGRMMRLARRGMGFAFTLLASFGTFGFFAIQGILLARMLGPSARGIFAATVLFPQVLLYLGLLGALELFAGYAAEGLSETGLRRSAARYGLFAGVVSAATCVVLDWLFIPEPMRFAMPLAILCALTMPLQQMRLAVQAVDHGQRALKRYNQVRLLAAAAFPTVLAIGFACGVRDVYSACYLFVLAQLLAFGLMQVGMRDSWLGPPAIPVRRALREGRGLMWAWLWTELLERLDVVLVMVLIASDRTMGFYSTAVPIASLMIIVPNAVGLYAFNRGARREEQITAHDAGRLIALGLAVQLVTGLALAAILPIVVPAFYSKDFGPTVYFAWLLLPAGAFRGLLQAADSYLRARKKPHWGINARLIGLPILIGFSVLGTPWLGAAAIPVGLSLAQLVCFCVVAVGVISDTRDSAASQT